MLHRAYFEAGTNGTLFCSGTFLCHTIELSWKDNKRSISCIPEGQYKIVTRNSKRFQNHLMLKGVKNRRLILVHPANNAPKELEGCIAPVTYLRNPENFIYSVAYP